MPLGVEEQEAAAAGADQFSPKRAAPASQLVPLVHLGVAHTVRALLLAFPVLVHELAELVEPSGLERGAASQAKILHLM